MKLRISFAALCTLVGTLLGATAISSVQAGPAWEVPQSLVQNMRMMQPLALGLISLAAIIVGTAYAIDRPRFLPLVLLAVQLLLGIVVVGVASPEIAGQWPVTHPVLSDLARHARIPLVGLSAGLAVGAVITLER